MIYFDKLAAGLFRHVSHEFNELFAIFNFILLFSVGLFLFNM